MPSATMFAVDRVAHTHMQFLVSGQDMELKSEFVMGWFQHFALGGSMSPLQSWQLRCKADS